MDLGKEPTYADMDAGGDALYSDPSAGRNFDPCIPRIIPIPVSDLGTHVAKSHFNGNSGFEEQYKVRAHSPEIFYL